MATARTEVSELSVCVGLNAIREHRSLPLSQFSFLEAAQNYCSLEQCWMLNDKIRNMRQNTFSEQVMLGYAMAFSIADKLNYEISDVRWNGFSVTDDSPADVYVSGIGISIKNNSNIIGNLGLSHLTKIISDNPLPRGTDIFEHFAKREYLHWFCCAIESLPHYWHSDNEDCSVCYDDRHLTIIHDTDIVKFNVDDIDSVPSCYDKMRKAGIKPSKSLSKAIASMMPTAEYIDAKSTCANKTGKAFVEYLSSNIKENGLPRLIGCRESEYWYCKGTSLRDIIINKVPSISDMQGKLRLTNIGYSVPKSQLNVLFSITNIETNRKIDMRAEARFSHGQFCGIPETKMYYANTTTPDMLYSAI